MSLDAVALAGHAEDIECQQHALVARVLSLADIPIHASPIDAIIKGIRIKCARIFDLYEHLNVLLSSYIQVVHT